MRHLTVMIERSKDGILTSIKEVTNLQFRKPGILKAAYGGASWDKHLIRCLNEVLLLLAVIMKYNAMIPLYIHL
jgi:hypothetical protein